MFMRKVLNAKLPSKLETGVLDKHFGGALSQPEEHLEGKFPFTASKTGWKPNATQIDLDFVTSTHL